MDNFWDKPEYSDSTASASVPDSTNFWDKPEYAESSENPGTMDKIKNAATMTAVLASPELSMIGNFFDPLRDFWHNQFKDDTSTVTAKARPGNPLIPGDLTPGRDQDVTTRTGPLKEEVADELTNPWNILGAAEKPISSFLGSSTLGSLGKRVIGSGSRAVGRGLGGFTKESEEALTQYLGNQAAYKDPQVNGRRVQDLEIVNLKRNPLPISYPDDPKIWTSDLNKVDRILKVNAGGMSKEASDVGSKLLESMRNIKTEEDLNDFSTIWSQNSSTLPKKVQTDIDKILDDRARNQLTYLRDPLKAQEVEELIDHNAKVRQVFREQGDLTKSFNANVKADSKTPFIKLINDNNGFDKYIQTYSKYFDALRKTHGVRTTVAPAERVFYKQDGKHIATGALDELLSAHTTEGNLNVKALVDDYDKLPEATRKFLEKQPEVVQLFNKDEKALGTVRTAAKLGLKNGQLPLYESKHNNLKTVSNIATSILGAIIGETTVGHPGLLWSLLPAAGALVSGGRTLPFRSPALGAVIHQFPRFSRKLAGKASAVGRFGGRTSLLGRQLSKPTELTPNTTNDDDIDLELGP